METARCAVSWKGVTEINICLASWKRCHGERGGRCDVMINAPSPTYRHPGRRPHTAGHIVPPTHCDPRSHPHTAVHIAPLTTSPTHLHRHSVTHALSAHRHRHTVTYIASPTPSPTHHHARIVIPPTVTRTPTPAT